MRDLVRGADRRRDRAARVLDLDLAEREAVDEEEDVRPPVLLADDDPELVDREELVALRVLEVDEPRARRPLSPPRPHSVSGTPFVRRS